MKNAERLASLVLVVAGTLVFGFGVGGFATPVSAAEVGTEQTVTKEELAEVGRWVEERLFSSLSLTEEHIDEKIAQAESQPIDNDGLEVNLLRHAVEMWNESSENPIDEAEIDTKLLRRIHIYFLTGIDPVTRRPTTMLDISEDLGIPSGDFSGGGGTDMGNEARKDPIPDQGLVVPVFGIVHDGARYEATWLERNRGPDGGLTLCGKTAVDLASARSRAKQMEETYLDVLDAEKRLNAVLTVYGMSKSGREAILITHMKYKNTKDQGTDPTSFITYVNVGKAARAALASAGRAVIKFASFANPYNWLLGSFDAFAKEEHLRHLIDEVGEGSVAAKAELDLALGQLKQALEAAKACPGVEVPPLTCVLHDAPHYIWYYQVMQNQVSMPQ